MKILIINTDYPAFLQSLYESNPGLAAKSYGEQMQVRNDSLFGVADFYSRNLQKLGHEAWDIHANNETIQAAWTREHGVKTSLDGWLHRSEALGQRISSSLSKAVASPTDHHE